MKSVAFIILLGSITLSGSDFKTRLIAETGVYHNSGQLSNQEFLVTQLDLKSSYKLLRRGYGLQADVRWQPQFYFSEVQELANRINMGLVFRKVLPFKFSGQTNLRVQRDDVGSNPFSFQSAEAGLNLNWQFSKRFAPSLSFTYLNSDYRFISQTDISAFRLGFDFAQLVKPGFKLRYGLQYQTYESSASGELQKSLRYGPQLKLSLRRSYSFDLTYRLLRLDIDGFQSSGLENYFRLVIGKLFAESWSVFIFSEGYSRSIDVQTEDNQTALFLPSESENRFYIKLERELSRRMALHLKSGYQRNDLLLSNVRFAGLQAVVGFSYKR